MPVQSVVVPHREIQEANTNPMAVLWTTQGVLRIIKNSCVESHLHSGQMHRKCYYCEVTMNNIKALPGCFRGSRQLGQTIVLVQ